MALGQPLANAKQKWTLVIGDSIAISNVTENGFVEYSFHFYPGDSLSRLVVLFSFSPGNVCSSLFISSF